MRKIIALTVPVLMVFGVACSSQERVTSQSTERSYSTTTTKSDLSPSPVQESGSQSFKREERSSSSVTTDPLAPSKTKEEYSNSMRTEEKATNVAPAPIDPPPTEEWSSSSTRVERKSSTRVTTE